MFTNHVVTVTYVTAPWRNPNRRPRTRRDLQFHGERATLPSPNCHERRPWMSDRGNGTEGGEETAILIPLHRPRHDADDRPVSFDRRELDQLLRLYGRMVAANEWRDYAIDHLPDRAVFSVYRRTSDAPLYQIVKDPKLARKQGMFSVVTMAGSVQKRGPELARVLGVFDKKLKLVGA